MGKVLEYFSNLWYSLIRIVYSRGVNYMKKYSALEIAEWFLNQNNYMQSITDTEYMTNLKLQKLLYYAQGIYLSKYKKPLFHEKIYAWEHGPVIKEVYNKYKSFGGKGIEFDGSAIEFPDEIDKFLESIYNRFGQYSAWKLRNMTHKEEPWLSTKQNDEIKTDVIKKYFESNNYGLC